MSNPCFSSYVLEGQKREIDALYDILISLSEKKEPAVQNGFGLYWLGCVVHELGGDWNKVNCRGTWSGLVLQGNIIRLSTETAWKPMNEVFDFIHEKFPSIRYYYSSEEPMMEEFYTNDKEGKYFSYRFMIDLCTPDDKSDNAYFNSLEDAFRWLRDNFHANVQSQEDVYALNDDWMSESDEGYCHLYEFIVDD